MAQAPSEKEQQTVQQKLPANNSTSAADEYAKYTRLETVIACQWNSAKKHGAATIKELERTKDTRSEKDYQKFQSGCHNTRWFYNIFRTN